MRKKGLIIAAVLILLLCLGFVKVQSQKSNIKTAINQHLSKEGYRLIDYKVYVSYHIENTLFGYNPYNISVQFSDDPQHLYFYDYNPKYRTVTQSGISATAPTKEKVFKHAE